MAIKLNKTESLFRNELIFAGDAKAVKIDNTILNLCLLLRFDGYRPKARSRRNSNSFIDLDKLNLAVRELESKGRFSGFAENEEAATMWIRSNLVNMVYRGNIEKENISSLRPIHLESYKVRNSKHARDYYSSEQVYLMLSADPSVRKELKDYLSEGWDQTTKRISNQGKLDVDSLGILSFVKEIDIKFTPAEKTSRRVSPILKEQAKLYCNDIHKLLVYKRKIPRAVVIDYLKTITAFHLSLYIRKLVHLLPLMTKEGTTQVEDNWNMVVDVTDNLESHISETAKKDAEKVYNNLYKYIRSTFEVNAVLSKEMLTSDNSENLIKALEVIKKKGTEFENYFKVKWNTLRESQDEDGDRELMDDLTEYEESFFDKYVQILTEVRGNYQYRYNTQFIDNISLKNDEKGSLVQGRSKKHPRRFVIGTKLLEALVQLIVLDKNEAGTGYTTKEISIDELISQIYSRYGLIINGLNHHRFENADLSLTYAFQENVEAFKSKLRKIGFYDDLSDAYILQKIQPRYSL